MTHIKTWADRLETLPDGGITTNAHVQSAMLEEIESLRTALAQQGQEPFATVTKDAGRMQIEFIGDLPDGETVRLYTAAPAPQPAQGDFESLIGEYWDLAYAEGQTGKSLGNEANEVLCKLRALQSAQPVAPLTDAWIRERTKQPWIFDTVKKWVKEIEAAHGISDQGASIRGI